MTTMASATKTTPLDILTSGDLARILGRTEPQIRYALKSRAIQPAGKAGVANVYHRAVIGDLQRALEGIDRSNARGNGVVAERLAAR